MTKRLFVTILLCSIIICITIGSKIRLPGETALAQLPETTSPVQTLDFKVNIYEHKYTILIVPGHDISAGGAHFKTLFERDLVVDIATQIQEHLSSSTALKVILARNKVAWHQDLQDFFDNDKQSILDFKNQHQEADKELIKLGLKRIIPDMASHSTADGTTTVQLYGINKWSEENNVDLIIHIHLNDSGRKNTNVPGPYSGFSMFIPEKQMTNSSSSAMVAKMIYSELVKILKPEIAGKRLTSIYEDQSLIALGASGTLTQPSVLIEYGYIYDKMFTNEKLRTKNINDIAEKTSDAIIEYYNSTITK